MTKIFSDSHYLLSRRALLGATLAGGVSLGFVGGANAFGIPKFGSKKKDNFTKQFNECMGVPLAVYTDMELNTFDKTALHIRMAAPAETSSARLPVVACCTDDDSALNYDLMAGSLAQTGYLVLTMSFPGSKISKNDAVLNTKRAQYVRFMLDKLPQLLSSNGVDKKMVDMDKIGMAGHGEGAWTALELIGIARGFDGNSSQADGRISGSYALTPLPVSIKGKRDDIEVNRIFGHGMIAANLKELPSPPKGSGIIGLGLPAESHVFGGLLGKKTSKTSDEPQREVLAAACAAGGMFFDWTLKGQKSKYEELLKLDGMHLPNVSKPLTLGKA